MGAEVIKIMSDDNGNKFIVENKNGVGVVNLSLASEKRVRRIGVIHYHKREIVFSRKRKKHLHNKTSSYGFNYYLLSHAVNFDHARIIDEKEEFYVPIQFLLDEGRSLFFKEQGFEKQLFVPLELLRNPLTALKDH